MSYSDKLIAMLLGILGTTIFHLAKGMQRNGIEIFSPGQTFSGKKMAIYLFGIGINISLPVMIIFANTFAPTSYFTSMFGLGLVALMIYSEKILKEPIQRGEYIGATILILGTLLLGLDGILQTPQTMASMKTNHVWIFAAGYFFVVILSMAIARQSKKVNKIGLTFGFFTGAAAAFDPIFKGIGQSMGGGSNVVPLTSHGWIFYSLSFAFGAASFLVTQWAFAHKARASVVVPVHNSIMITMPILVQTLALPGFSLTILSILGMFLTIAGIVMMHLVIEEFEHGLQLKRLHNASVAHDLNSSCK